MKGLSRKEYLFKYDSELSKFIYETESQEEVDDIFTASFRLYRHFDFMPIMDEKKVAPPKKATKKKAKASVEKEEFALA